MSAFIKRKCRRIKMKIIQVISEWKKRSPIDVSSSKKMVEAVVEIDGEKFTRHIAVPKK